MRQTLTSVVFRLPRRSFDALQRLSRATRVRQSEYLREAIADLLRKYPEPPAAQAPERVEPQREESAA